MSERYLIIEAKRDGYSPDQVGRTMTVGELIEFLKEFDEDRKVVLSHDGYMYGAISDWGFSEKDEEGEDEE